MNKREEQDRLAKIILSYLERYGKLCRTDLLKLTLRRCGTPRKFDSIFEYLRRKGFVEKLGEPRSRAPYKITEKGRKFLEVLNSAEG